MRYNEITPVMRKFIGTFEVVRSFGFSADEIFLGTVNDLRLGCLACHLIIKAQGRSFNIVIGKIKNAETLEAEYDRVTKALSTRELQDRDVKRMALESEAYNNWPSLVMSLCAKGFVISGTRPDLN